jgi:hypothetical protein
LSSAEAGKNAAPHRTKKAAKTLATRYIQGAPWVFAPAKHLARANQASVKSGCEVSRKRRSVPSQELTAIRDFARWTITGWQPP